MKKTILSIGPRLELEGIDNSDLLNADSFTDYDDIIIDPECPYSSERTLPAVTRRRDELNDFFGTRAGNLICFLRSNKNLYSWFPDADMYLTYLDFDENTREYRRNLDTVRFPGGFNIIHRNGKRIGALNETHPFAAYFLGLGDEIQYCAVISDESQHLDNYVIARDRTGKIIPMELPIGIGRVILLPPNRCKDSKKVGGILLNCLQAFESGPSTPPGIEWLGDFSLHGEDEVREKIQTIHDAVSELKAKEQELVTELEGITKYKVLLWGKHQRPLEPVVRAALRLIGLNIFEKEAYDEDYDIYGKEGDLFIVGEVEGSKDQIDVKKFRQLLDYCQEEMDKDHAVKGLLIGNGLCEDKPETRGLQFTDRAIQRSESQGFCCLTTYALFKIVKAVLSNEMDESLKQKVKQGILATHGVFNLDKWLNSS